MDVLDGCDRCGAQAQAVVWMEHGELLFCAHHARAYGFTDCLPSQPTPTP